MTRNDSKKLLQKVSGKDMSMIINGKTGLTGLLGSPVGHSKSPMMHNTSFQELGINYVYLCFDVGIEGLSGAVDGLVSLGAKGWNCTMPNKSKMAQLCDVLSPAASITGSVNTVVNEMESLWDTIRMEQAI